MGLYNYTDEEISKIDPDAIPDFFLDSLTELSEDQKLQIQNLNPDLYNKINNGLEAGFANNLSSSSTKKNSKGKRDTCSIRLLGNPSVFFPIKWDYFNPICPEDNNILKLRSYIVNNHGEIRFDAWGCPKCHRLFMPKKEALALLQKAPFLQNRIKRGSTAQKNVSKNDKPEIYHLSPIALDAYRKTTGVDILTMADHVVIGACTSEEYEKRTRQVMLALKCETNTSLSQKYCSLTAIYCEDCEKYFITRQAYKNICKHGYPLASIYDPDIEYSVSSKDTQSAFKEEDAHLKKLQEKISYWIQQEQSSPNYVSQYETLPYLDDGGLRDKKSRNYELKHKIDALAFLAKHPYKFRVDLASENQTRVFYLGDEDINKPGILDEHILSSYSDIGKILVNHRETSIWFGGISYSVKRRRELDIQGGVLKNVTEWTYDNGITDTFLAEVLRKRRAAHQLVDIIPTIQKNQNTIIDEPIQRNIIVQGCAGSGKTSVMLQRLASLKYKNSDFDFSRVVILTPSKNFNTHIEGLATSLQLTNIERLSFEEYYESLLVKYNKDFRLKYSVTNESNVPSPYLDFIYSEDFLPMFWKAYSDKFKDFMHFYHNILPCVKNLQASQEDLGDDMPVQDTLLSLLFWINQLNKRINQILHDNANKTRLDACLSLIPKEVANKEEIAVLLEQLKNFNINNIYNEIYSVASKEADDYLFTKTGGRYLSKCHGTHRYDLYLKVLFAQKVYGFNSGNNTLICVDEGQDTSLSEYRLICNMNSDKCVLNIFGDLSQSLKPNRGINDWNVLKDCLDDPAFFELTENFRNTNQITHYCNATFKMNIASTGIDGGHVSIVTRRRFEELLTELSIEDERVAILIPRTMKKSSLKQIRFPSKLRELLGEHIGNGRICVAYVDEIKGIEFDNVYVFLNGMSRNERYIAYTRALSNLTLVHDLEAEMSSKERNSYHFTCWSCEVRKELTQKEWESYQAKDPILNVLCPACRANQNKLVYKVRPCTECNRIFTIYEGERIYFEFNGLKIPNRCPECRKKHRKNKLGL